MLTPYASGATVVPGALRTLGFDGDFAALRKHRRIESPV